LAIAVHFLLRRHRSSSGFVFQAQDSWSMVRDTRSAAAAIESCLSA
jgi:hypothetical protein